MAEQGQELTFRDSRDSVDQPGSVLGLISLVTHVMARGALGAPAQVPLGSDSVFPLPTRFP